MTDENVHHIDEADLGELLRRLFIDDAAEEVEVHHPTEGVVVYTRDAWLAQIEALEKAAKMSPAERIQELNRLERKMAMKFRTAMVSASVRTVDIEDDDPDRFGLDVDGELIPIEGLVFTPVDLYPKGIEIIPNEIGAFVHESMRQAPIRILAKKDGDQAIH